MDELLAFANGLADVSGAHLRQAFRRPFRVEAKADASPVTEVDRAVERLLRDRITEAFPEHGILGEEFGGERLEAKHVWVLDPIDGTRSFVAGKPLFGTLIGLLQGGRPILGVIDHPATGERWSGHPSISHFGSLPCRTRTGVDLERAIVATTAPHHLRPGAAETFQGLRARVRDIVYGCDCYAYGLLASGHVDLVIEEGLGVHDWCALAPVIEGAGGRITDWKGQPLVLSETPPDQVLAAGSVSLHDQALDLFRRHAR